MKKIVGMLRPFEMKQRWFVYENGNKIDVKEITVDEVISSLFELVEKHSVKNISLVGPKQYAKGIERQIKTTINDMLEDKETVINYNMKDKNLFRDIQIEIM